MGRPPTRNPCNRPQQGFLHPRALQAPTRDLNDGDPRFLGWLQAHHPRLTGRDLGRLIGTAVDAGRTAAFVELWRLWERRGATLDDLGQASAANEEKWRHQPHINPFWRESLAHRVFGRWTDEEFPDRMGMWEALRNTGLMRAGDRTNKGGTLLHSLLSSSSFQFQDANPSAALRRDTLAVALELVELGVAWDEPDAEGVRALDLARTGLPDLAEAWDAETRASGLRQGLPGAKKTAPLPRL